MRTAAGAQVGFSLHFSRPRLGDARRDHVMNARVRRGARADAAERRPEARIAIGPRALEDPPA
jgi:hypothetical protein